MNRSTRSLRLVAAPPPSKTKPIVYAVPAIDVMMVVVRDLGELFDRLKDRYQARPADWIRQEAGFLKLACETRLKFLRLSQAERLAMPEAADLVKKLYGALQSVVTHLPEGDWFNRETRSIRAALRMIERTAREQLALDLSVLAELHGQPGSIPKNKRHLSLV